MTGIQGHQHKTNMVVIHGLESGFSGKEKEQQRQACITNQLIRQVTQPSPVPCFGGNDVVNPSIRHYFISIDIYYLFATDKVSSAYLGSCYCL